MNLTRSALVSFLILYCTYKLRNQTNKRAPLPRTWYCFSINGPGYGEHGVHGVHGVHGEHRTDHGDILSIAEFLCTNHPLDCVLQHNRAQTRLLCLFYNKESVKFPTRYFQFLKEILCPKGTTMSSACSVRK